MESRTIPPAQASARLTEMGDAFNRVLFSALDALQEQKIPYALIGGIAASGLGRPRSTHDIDVFVRPEDAEAALEALGKHGFETERTDARWLFKGWKEEMMVDIIFKSSGDIYFDNEMYSRAKPISYHGRNIPAVAPEDLIIIKAAVHSEVGPHHWHDALAILSHANVDWQYLVKRARRAARRILALLIYAQSNDIWIPNYVINDLYETIFAQGQSPSHHPQAPSRTNAKSGSHIFGFTDSAALPPEIGQMSGQMTGAEMSVSVHTTPTKPMPELYLRGHILEALAQNSRTAALDVQLMIGGNRIVVKGECPSDDHRSAIEDVVREIASGFDVENHVRITEVKDPEVEEVV